MNLASLDNVHCVQLRLRRAPSWPCTSHSGHRENEQLTELKSKTEGFRERLSIAAIGKRKLKWEGEDSELRKSWSIVEDSINPAG